MGVPPNPSNAKSAFSSLFEWSPPLLAPHPNHKRSNGTRKPAFIDMHLHELLVLKNIRILPNLLDEISNIADEAAAHHPLSQTFDRPAIWHPTKGDSENVDGLFFDLDMYSEESVVSFYRDTMARLCAPAASTLALGLPEYTNIFKWVTHADKNDTSAIADGFLRIFESPPFSLTDESKRDLNDISKWFRNLIIWEFKSLLAGSSEVMNHIGSLEGDFDWILCTPDAKCPGKIHEIRGRRIKTGTKTGLDAICTPWTLPSSVAADGCLYATDAPDKVKDIFEEDDIFVSEWLDDSEAEEYTEDVKPPGKLTKSRVNRTDVKPAMSVQEKSTHIVQQWWMEAVRSDATIMILNSGNYEYIGIRHRATQTLYLSPLIEVHKCRQPAYGKLHTGLYIAAYRDALNRAKILQELQDHGKKLPVWYRKHYFPSEHTDSQPLSQGSESEDPQLTDKERIEHVLDSLRATNHLAIDIVEPAVPPFLSAFPLHLTRCGTSDSELSYGVDENTEPLLLKRMSDRVYEAHIKFPGTYGVNNQVVVKLAWTPQQRSDLKHEFNTLRFLKDKNRSFGVPEPFGIFDCATEYEEFSALVMQHMGISLSNRPYLPKRIRDDFRVSLTFIQNKGRLHGNITADHLMVQMNRSGTSGIVGFVSWGRSSTIDRSAKGSSDAVQNTTNINVSRDLKKKKKKKNYEHSEDYLQPTDDEAVNATEDNKKVAAERKRLCLALSRVPARKTRNPRKGVFT